ncbi:MAG: polymer-forming cytoskeletal protein [Gammaproteobacteria bacterium]|jgi:cytoskeletal protein CcmA (bactofilin family)
MWGNNGSSGSKRKTAKVETLVGEGTCVAGDVTFTGGLHVDGTVRGNITAANGDGMALLVVGEHGKVEGEVQVPQVVISGSVVGDVRAAESVELAPNSQVTGNIYYTRIEMAMGASVNGQLIHVSQEKGQVLLPAAENETPSEVERKVEKFHVVDS